MHFCTHHIKIIIIIILLNVIIKWTMYVTKHNGTCINILFYWKINLLGLFCLEYLNTGYFVLNSIY